MKYYHLNETAVTLLHVITPNFTACSTSVQDVVRTLQETRGDASERMTELRDTVWLSHALVRKCCLARKARATAVPLVGNPVG